MNSRVFDALASGTLVLTNNVEGSEELFGGLLPTYTGRDDLRAFSIAISTTMRHEYNSLSVCVRRCWPTTPTREPSRIHPPGTGTNRASSLRHQDWGPGPGRHALLGRQSFRFGLGRRTHPGWDADRSPHPARVGLAPKTGGGCCDPLTRAVELHPKPAHLNIMWLVSHPNDVSVRELDKYDLVLIASRRHAEWLQGQTQTPIVFMPQATDHRRFHPVEPDPKLANEVVFLGNSRGQKRPAVDWAIDRGLPLSVYGGDWTGRIPAAIPEGRPIPERGPGSPVCIRQGGFERPLAGYARPRLRLESDIRRFRGRRNRHLGCRCRTRRVVRRSGAGLLRSRAAGGESEGSHHRRRPAEGDFT